MLAEGMRIERILSNFSAILSIITNSIILWIIESENERGTVHANTHACEVRLLVLGVSATWEPIIFVGAKSMEILKVMIHY